jgi:hypothetical protein
MIRPSLHLLPPLDQMRCAVVSSPVRLFDRMGKLVINEIKAGSPAPRPESFSQRHGVDARMSFRFQFPMSALQPIRCFRTLVSWPRAPGKTNPLGPVRRCDARSIAMVCRDRGTICSTFLFVTVKAVAGLSSSKVTFRPTSSRWRDQVAQGGRVRLEIGGGMTV